MRCMCSWPLCGSSLTAASARTGETRRLNPRQRTIFQVWRTCLNVANLFLNAEKFNRWLERYPVNSLFGQLHGIKPDASDLVALPLPRDVEPALLFYGVALALVVTGGVSLLGLFP